MSRVAARARITVLAELPWARILTVAGVLLRVVLLLIAMDKQAGSYDLRRYFNIVNGGVPYRDQSVEYPPVTVIVLEAVHLIAHSRTTFGIAVILLMALIEAGVCVLMWRAFGRLTGVSFVILDTILYYILLTRIDILPTALSVFFLALALGRRPVSAGVVWVAAVGAKLWPAPLGVFLLTGARSARVRWRSVAAAFAAGVVLIGGWFAVGGTTGIRDVLSLRGAQGWQIESMVGAVLHAAGRGTVIFEEGSDRIGQVPAGVGAVMQLVGVVAAVCVCVWAARRDRPGTGWLAAVLCLLITSTLLSPQFLVWGVPGAALAVRERRHLLAGLFAATLVLTVLENHVYGSIVDGSRLGQGLLLLRNLLLIACFAAAVRALR